MLHVKLIPIAGTLNDFGKLLQFAGIRFIKAIECGTVNIQYPYYFPLPMQRYYYFRIGSTVAGDMAGELMDVPYKLHFIL